VLPALISEVAVLATVVDTSALAKVVVASIVGAIGVTLAVSLAILGVIRFDDMRRSERVIEAGAFAMLAAVATIAFAVAVIMGVIVMTSK
jgi:hypothetical protein